jgi:hypothetical protein
LEAEILFLRHQLNIQRRHLPKGLTFSAMDRLIFACGKQFSVTSGTIHNVCVYILDVCCRTVTDIGATSRLCAYRRH